MNNNNNQTDLKRDAKRSARANGQRLTRRRVPLSCEACRVRKLKCNREKPCQNCIVRGESNAASCVYAEKMEKKSFARANPRSDAEDMRKRLNRLESSILSMMDLNGSTNSISPSSHDTNSESIDQRSINAGDQNTSVDNRSTHWVTILNEIGAMKDAWSEENDKIEYSTGFQSTTSKEYRLSLLSGLSAPPDCAIILGSLPSKETARKLISRFFNAYIPALPARFAVHEATFLKQFEKHYSNPSQTKLIWIGLLYSILTFAMQSYHRNNDSPSEYEGTLLAATDLYRIRTAQCLVISNLAKPCEFMIETLIIYGMSEYTSERDGDMGTFLIAGTLMRLALKMGYHRDPSQNPNISAFQGEMRRRVWCLVNQNDAISCELVGVPKHIKYTEFDTRPPSNIHENEMYEEMTELPPCRPLTEITQTSYQVIKCGIMNAYSHITDFLHRLQPQPYEEVMRLDLMLMKARETIPCHFRNGTLEEMKNNPSYVVMEKCALEHFFHKAVCILHRKFWDASPTVSNGINVWQYSRKACTSSALSLLYLQVTMHNGCRPGGPLTGMKWYHWPLHNHDFLLAAMILCLDIINMRNVSQCELVSCIITEAEKLSAIQRSREIWAETVDDCRDAPRAVRILDTVLAKLLAKKKTIVPLQTDELQPISKLTICKKNLTPTGPCFMDVFVDNMFPPSEDVVMQDNFFDSIDSGLTPTGEFDWDAWDLILVDQNTL